MIVVISIVLSLFWYLPQGNIFYAAEQEPMDSWWTVSVESDDERYNLVSNAPTPELKFSVKAIYDSGPTLDPDVGDSAVQLEQDLMLQLSLPEGLSLPDGNLHVEGNQIFCGDTVLFQIIDTTGIIIAGDTETLPDDVTGVKVEPGEDNSVIITLERHPADSAFSWENMSNLGFDFIVKEGALVWNSQVPESNAQIELDAVLYSQFGQDHDSGHQTVSDSCSLPVSVEGNPDADYSKIQAEDITVESTSTETHEIFWVDNGNEESKRPDIDKYKEKMPELWFTMDSGPYAGYKIQLTDETKHLLGYGEDDEIPTGDVEENGAGSYTYSVNGLPSEVTYTPEGAAEGSTINISWEVRPQEQENYALVNVTDDNADQYPSVNGQTGWYYVLKTDLVFEIDLRAAKLNLTEDQETRKKLLGEIFSQFSFNVQGHPDEYILLTEISGDDIKVTFNEDGSGWTITLTNGWKYNLDGTRLVYTIERAGGNASDPIYSSLTNEDGDWFNVLYNNANAPGYGSVDDKIHDGGKVTLTLDGKKDYNAAKVWLDKNVDPESRPGGTFYLWRYLSNQDFASASFVQDANGQQMSCTIDPDGTITIDGKTVDGQEITFEDLPKYSPDGYEYVYVVRESLEYEEGDLQYEKVFGSVGEDGTITDRVYDNAEKDWEDYTYPDGQPDTNRRPSQNEFLYNGGTLSNRISDTTTASVIKEWNAAAFQVDFDDVLVKLTLQRRPDMRWRAWPCSGCCRRRE